ncbi:MAG: DNA-binding transcriptional regulator [Planctomycetia bacterium]|nr:DNA-binding transcriptional regulator [Planctomycetia bacterium]
MSTELKRVAILIETSTTWGAEMVAGIAEYARQHGKWSIFVEPRGRHERLRMPRDWHGDGIIARVTHPLLGEDVKSAGLPAVNVSWIRLRDFEIPQVTADEAAVGRLAAQHFLDRGFRNFAYFGPDPRHGYEDRLGPTFEGAIAQAGGNCHVYQARRSSGNRVGWLAEISDLIPWLRSLPKPAALLTWNDIRARQVTEACRESGLSVPEDVAVLGGEYDALTSEVSIPPLSSIDHNPRRVGYEAAHLLARMMEGEAAPSEPVLVPLRGVIQRQSTNTLAIEDRPLAEALQFIRTNLHRPIGVGDVVEATSLSRRLLEQRFQKAIGRSPAAEIRRVRIERAKQLLSDTRLSVSQVALASGFNFVEAMNVVFRREVGVTPTQYRRQTSASSLKHDAVSLPSSTAARV